MKNHQAGITIIELLCGLVILSVVSGGVANVYGNAREEARILQANSETTDLTHAVLRSYVVSSSFAALSTESAVSEGWMPVDLLGPTGRPTNVWGKTIDLGHIDFGPPAAGLTLTQEVPAVSCPKWVSSLSRGYDTIRINGQEVSRRAQSLKPQALVSPCSVAGEFASVVLIARKL